MKVNETKKMTTISVTANDGFLFEYVGGGDALNEVKKLCLDYEAMIEDLSKGSLLTPCTKRFPELEFLSFNLLGNHHHPMYYPNYIFLPKSEEDIDRLKKYNENLFDIITISTDLTIGEKYLLYFDDEDMFITSHLTCNIISFTDIQNDINKVEDFLISSNYV